ncbi:alginate export family protein [Solimonas flava]|uniref:alginate export family protein n=1 Tax=Solimonas flava TaxID=415849 RepID=UPI001378DF1B|nr:alginate export family protein [Solimonas flava]
MNAIHSASTKAQRMLVAVYGLCVVALGGAWQPAIAADSDSTSVRRLPPGTGDGARYGEYYFLRFNEPAPAAGAGRDDLFAPLKRIALGDSTDGAYLSFSGLERFQFNSYSHETLASTNYDDQRFYQFRHIYGADLHLSDSLRFFGELGSGQVDKTHAGPQPGRQVNDLVAQQYFVESSAQVGDGRVTARVGRQGMWLGNGLLVSTQPNANIPWSFDGADVSYRDASMQIEAFRVEAAGTGTGGIDDDRSMPERRMWGVYSSFALPHAAQVGAHLNVDAFYLGTRWENMKYGGVAGTDRRSHFGVRLWGGAGQAIMDWTAVMQRGRFAGKTVSAYALYSVSGYAFPQVRWKPTLLIHADLISGGESASKIGTYNPLYSGQLYYTATGYLAGSNLIDAGPGISLKLSPRFTLNAYNRWYWKKDKADYVYGRGFVPLATTANTSSSYMGMQPDVDFSWEIQKHLYLTTYLSYFDSGSALKQSGGKDIAATYVDLSFLF